MSKHAVLRTCASCEWIFRYPSGASAYPHNSDWDCPKCGWVSYGARYAYGNRCYRHEHTQYPWYEKKMSDYSCKLTEEISKTTPKKNDYFA